ncbi:sensor histidine kinase [Sulfitobacter sp.]|uniref:sensor histidine kinase n=1 Tax=Sulfitobacter sp. TaxID=1903071 RepID=UPI00300315DF
MANDLQGFDLLADAVVIFDASSGDVTYKNSEARAIATQSADAGTPLLTLLDWTGKPTDFFRPLATASPDDPKTSWRLEAQLAELLFDVHVNLGGTDAETNFVAAVFRDISKRSETERLTKELVSTVSHELRSPLTAIKGAMGLIISGAAGELSSKARDMVLIAQRNADRLVLIINDILDLDKFASGQTVFDNAPTDLLTIVESAVEAIAGFKGRFDVRIEVDVQDSGLTSFVDPNRLVQVFVNLLSNAIKFSPSGGVVTVRLARDGENNRISVIDVGEGIPEADQEALFGRFVQIGAKNRAATGGTGLGLSIVKAILDNQSGSISFESRLGQGTIFTVDLPQLSSIQTRAQAKGA